MALIKIDDSNIVADTTALQAIPVASIGYNAVNKVGIDFYHYYNEVMSGDYEPDDKPSGDPGWWIKNNPLAISLMAVVATLPAGATDVSSLSNWDTFGIKLGETVLSVRSEIKIIYDAIGTPTTSEKEIASKWFAVDKAVRDAVHTSDEQKENAVVIYGFLDVRSLEQEFVDEITLQDTVDAKLSIEAIQKTITDSEVEYLDVSGVVTLTPSFHPIASHHVRFNGDGSIVLDCVPKNLLILLSVEQDGTGGHAVSLPFFDNKKTQPSISMEAGSAQEFLIVKNRDEIHLHGYERDSDDFTFTQATPATVWNINHNMNRFPSAVLLDNSGNLMDAEILYVDDKNITITFSPSAQAGVVHLN